MSGDRDDKLDLPDPRVVARTVRIRRIKRRLKAAASLAIAVVAGTYVACSGQDKHRPTPANNPSTNETSNLPGPSDAGAGDALVHVAAPKDAAVDRDEHRRGMPVPDNLLE
jgi:hypothetical protein